MTEKPEKSEAYKRADSRMSSLAEDTLNKAFDHVRDLPEAEQKQLIEDWLGDDMWDFYVEWLAENE